MRCDFKIKGGIYLCQPPYEVDLHNYYDFDDLSYSVQTRTLSLRWQRAQRVEDSSGNPSAVAIVFEGVEEFRFQPRDAEIPFTEDTCVSCFGSWTDEEWSHGAILISDPPEPNAPGWLTAIQFMSRATLLVRASSAHAKIQP